MISSKALNDTIVPEGLAPSVLLVGEFSLPYSHSEQKPIRPTVDERATTAALTEREISETVAHMRVNRGSRHAIPPVANHFFQPGKQILV